MHVHVGECELCLSLRGSNKKQRSYCRTRLKQVKMVTWQWRSDNNPCDWDTVDPQWTSYPADDSDRIEEAYLSPVRLRVIVQDYYCIDVVKCLQFVENHPVIQRPIRRSFNGEHQRETCRSRFYEIDGKYFPTFAMGRKVRSLLPDSWQNDFTRCRPNYSKRDVVEAAIAGIREEGEKLGRCDQASKIIEHLQAARDNRDPDAVKQQVVRLYTGATFLYKFVNEVLREPDKHRYRDTVGPYCHLLRGYLYQEAHQDKFHRGVVYRGAWLHPRMIDRYKEEISGKTDKFPLMWLGFTSTTKNREIAELFNGNTLFIIDLDDHPYFTSQGVDISDISKMPQEEEVLLPPGFQFQCTGVDTFDGKQDRTSEGAMEGKPYQHFEIYLRARQHYG